MKKKILFIISVCCLLFASCEYDNFDEPKSTLSGKVVYDGKPIGLRTNGPQLELWQDGFGLRKSIPVYLAHDGSFSAVLFNGQYKMVRKAGGPWQPQLSDTIIIDVRGNTVTDVPVIPYFVINNESYQKGVDDVTAKFTINKIVESADISEVRLYLGMSILTDQNKNEQAVSADISKIITGQETSLIAKIPSSLTKYDYIFARIGVRSTVSNEFYYTQVQRVDLK